MALKDSLTKGITAINVKTNNFMEQSKCKTYISTLESEINNLKFQIGEQIYAEWLKNQGVEGYSENRWDATVENNLNTIMQKYNEIKLQEEKMEKLLEEEKQILGTVTSQQNYVGDVCYCSQCGTQNSVDYKFCCKCGNPLK